MGEGVVDMDCGLQLLDATDRDPIGLGQPGQAVEPSLVTERRVDPGLELIARLLSALTEILLCRADLVEYRRDEAIAHFARFPDTLDLSRQRAAQRAKRRDADERGNHESRQKARQEIGRASCRERV